MSARGAVTCETTCEMVLCIRPQPIVCVCHSVMYASMGLVNRVVPAGTVREAAESLALSLCSFPQGCMRADRWSVLHGHEGGSKALREALARESAGARHIIQAESVAGASRFMQGALRHGRFAHQETAATADAAATAAASSFSATAASSSASAATAAPAVPLSPSTGVSRLRCVWFDLGGVVVESPVGAILAYERSLGLAPHTLNMLLGRSRHFEALERGELELEDFAPLFEAEVRSLSHPGLAQLELDGVAKTLFGLMASAALRPRPPMLAAIGALRASEPGLVVAALTNNWRVPVRGRGSQPDTRAVMMQQLDQELFHFVIESASVGMRKPEPRIFELAIQKANEWMRTAAAGGPSGAPVAALQADQVLFLDDLGVNLKAAQKCGMATIKVTSDYGLALRQLSSLTGVALDAIIATIPPTTAAAASASTSASAPLQAKL